jgi:hypothetical protein
LKLTGDLMKAHRLGYWSSAAVATIGVAYIITLAAGFARHGFREPITDPVLAIMEILTLLSAPALLFVMASIHDVAAPDRKIYGLIAVAFATPGRYDAAFRTWPRRVWLSRTRLTFPRIQTSRP